MDVKNFAAGLDIGGTKCAAVLGEISDNDTIRICGKKKIATADYPDPEKCLHHLCDLLLELLVLIKEFPLKFLSFYYFFLRRIFFN